MRLYTITKVDNNYNTSKLSLVEIKTNFINTKKFN